MNHHATLRLVSPIQHSTDRGQTTVLGPRAQVSFSDKNGALARGLNRFDGFQATPSVISSLVAESDQSTDTVEALVRGLLDVNAIIDAWNIPLSAHAAGDNPQSFPVPLGAAEVKSLTHERAGLFEGPQVSTSQPGTLFDLFQRRTSTRSFLADPVPRGKLTTILHWAGSASMRANPSAGALRSTCIDVLYRHEVTGEWHHENWEEISCKLVTRGLIASESRHLRFVLDSETILYGAPCLIVLSANLEVHAKKYGNRGYRLALLEIGHVAQSLTLAAVELGYATLEWAAFRDEALHQLLGQDEVVRPLVVLAVGRGAGYSCGDDLASTLGILSDWQQQAGPGHQMLTLKEPLTLTGPAGIVIAQSALPASSGSSNDRADQRATGVAFTSALARVRSAAESLERASCAPDACTRVGTAATLDAETVFDVLQLFPATLPAFAEDGYSAFARDVVYDWSIGRMAADPTVWVPSELVHYPYRVDRPKCGFANSNGVAVASTVRDAEQAAFDELIERNAYVECWLSQTAPPRWTRWPAWFDEAVYHLGIRQEQATVQFYPDAAQPTVSVAIRSQEHPALSFGMATKEGWLDALEKAFLESAGSFLAAKSKPAEDPSPEIVSPADHAHYYHDLRRRSRVDWYFEGDANLSPSSSSSSYQELRDGTTFVNLSLPGNPLASVRALSPLMRPLWFHPRWRPTEDPNNEPHFFA